MSDNLPAQARGTAGDIMEAVIIKGDLAKLTPQERVQYYNQTCKSLGLNPLTRPFEYVTYQGRLVLYARRDCADQLRRIHGISLEVMDRKQIGDMLIVHCRATTPAGRKDEDMGAVSIAGLKGEALANAMLKCTTKAKRRVTLSICGLGMLDETETEPDDMPASTADQLEQFAQEPAASTADRLAAAPLVRPRSTLWDDPSYQVTPQKDPATGDAMWARWADQMVYLVTEATEAELAKLHADNSDCLGMLRRADGDAYRDITRATTARRAELQEKLP